MVLLWIGILVVVILVWVLVVVLPLHNALDSLPVEYQLMSPSSVFLLFIPLFNLVWLFFVVIRVSTSFQNFFAAHNQNRGDCGYGVGLAWAICGACGVIPVVNYLTGIGAFVCMIIYIVTVSDRKNVVRGMVEANDLAELNGPSLNQQFAAQSPTPILPEIGSDKPEQF